MGTNLRNQFVKHFCTVRTMLKITLILATIAVAMANSIPSNGKSNVLVQVVTRQEMDDLLKQNPKAKLLSPQVKQKSELMSGSRDVTQYWVGSRQVGKLEYNLCRTCKMFKTYGPL